MYLGLAGMYINLLNAEFVYDILGGLSIQSFLAILLPWAAWLMGEFYRLIYIYYIGPLHTTTERKQFAFIPTATFFTTSTIFLSTVLYLGNNFHCVV